MLQGRSPEARVQIKHCKTPCNSRESEAPLFFCNLCCANHLRFYSLHSKVVCIASVAFFFILPQHTNIHRSSTIACIDPFEYPFLDDLICTSQVIKFYDHMPHDKIEETTSVCRNRQTQQHHKKKIRGVGLGSGFLLTPSLPGTTHFQTRRLTDPSGSVSGFATNP